jgi:hypothetical protein
MSRGSISMNDYQVRKLAYNSNGEFLSAIFFDEILKKYQIDIYNTNSRQTISSFASPTLRSSIAWHPKIPSILACAGEIKVESQMGQSLNGHIELIHIK